MAQAYRSRDGTHGPDVPVAPRVDPQRLDGLPPVAARERPGGLRPPEEQGEAARERGELRGPHGPDGPRNPLDPPRDGEGDRERKAYTYAYGYATRNGEEHRRGGRRVRDALEGGEGGRELQRRDPPAREGKEGQPTGLLRTLGRHPGGRVPRDG